MQGISTDGALRHPEALGHLGAWLTYHQSRQNLLPGLESIGQYAPPLLPSQAPFSGSFATEMAIVREIQRGVDT